MSDKKCEVREKCKNCDTLEVIFFEIRKLSGHSTHTIRFRDNVFVTKTLDFRIDCAFRNLEVTVKYRMLEKFRANGNSSLSEE